MLTGPNGPEQPHLVLHPHPCPWAQSHCHRFSGAMLQTDLCPTCSLTFLPCWLDFLGWHQVLFVTFCQPTSLGCWQDSFLSLALLCSPSLSTLCLAGGGTALPWAGVTLSSLSLMYREMLLPDSKLLYLSWKAARIGKVWFKPIIWLKYIII